MGVPDLGTAGGWLLMAKVSTHDLAARAADYGMNASIGPTNDAGWTALWADDLELPSDGDAWPLPALAISGRDPSEDADQLWFDVATLGASGVVGWDASGAPVSVGQGASRADLAVALASAFGVPDRAAAVEEVLTSQQLDPTQLAGALGRVLPLPEHARRPDWVDVIDDEEVDRPPKTSMLSTIGVSFAWTLVAGFGGAAVWLLASIVGDGFNAPWLVPALLALYGAAVIVLTLGVLGKGGRVVDALFNAIMLTFMGAMVVASAAAAATVALFLVYGLSGEAGRLGISLDESGRWAVSIGAAVVAAGVVLVGMLRSKS